MNYQTLIEKALSLRSDILESGETNTLRLFDGNGDGMPDVFIDKLNDTWLLSTREGVLPEGLSSALRSFNTTIYWKKLDQHEKESPSLMYGAPLEKPFLGKENELNYELSYDSGYSQGIFLDQRENRARVKNVSQPGLKVLNTFSYTGAFSVAAAAAGATTTTLDLSQPYLDWAKRNMEHNSISPADHYFCKGDTFHWLNRFSKSGKQFDGIILDPPTFSRDAKGKVFRVEKDYHRLVALAASILAPGGWILACTNCRKLPEWQFEEQLEKGAPHLQYESLPMPPEYRGEQYLKSYWLTPSE